MLFFLPYLFPFVQELIACLFFSPIDENQMSFAVLGKQLCLCGISKQSNGRGQVGRFVAVAAGFGGCCVDLYIP